MKLLRFIWAHLGDARGLYVAGLVATFIEGLAAAAPALAVGLGLTRLAQGGATAGDIWPYAAAILVSVPLRMILVRLAWSWAFKAGCISTEAIRNRLVDHMRRAPLGILQHWSSAKLASLITEDGRWLNEVSTFVLSRMVAGAATVLCLVVVITAFDFVVGVVLITSFAFGFIALPISSRILKGVIARRNSNLAVATQRVGEYGDGIAVFRSFGQTGAALSQLKAAVDELYRLMMRQTPILVALNQVMGTFIGTAVPFAICVTASLVIWRGGAPDALRVLPALFLALAAKNALLVGILKPIIILRLGIQAREGMAKFLAEPTFAGTSSTFGTPLDICFDNVSFRYGHDKPAALDGVTFRAPQGGVTAIVGQSGAGKSTITALLLRFFDADSGRVTVGGLDVRQSDPSRLQSLVSLVNQDVHLFRDTLRANILLGDPTASPERLLEVIKAARLEDLVAALPDGLETMLGDTGRTLSGGERQRVAVARALLKDAPIIILDEATSAMDPLTERSIQEAVGALEHGRTVIVIAHRLHTIAGADEILIVDGGRIIERGRHHALRDKGGLYARLWQAQERAAGWRLR